MAFTVTNLRNNTVIGGVRIVTGTYTNTSGSTGGDIKTGLSMVNAIVLQAIGSSVGNAPKVNETTFPRKDGITIVTGSNEVGTFIATGI